MLSNIRTRDSMLVLLCGPPRGSTLAGKAAGSLGSMGLSHLSRVSLCIIDSEPRLEFGPRQRHTLKEFAVGIFFVYVFKLICM